MLFALLLINTHLHRQSIEKSHMMFALELLIQYSLMETEHSYNNQQQYRERRSQS